MRVSHSCARMPAPRTMVHLTQQQTPTMAHKLAPQEVPRCKKKINFPPYSTPPPASVARRNARERNRVKQVNNGFATLRQHIPSTVTATIFGNGRGSSKKLSKVDTLRLAVEYIRSLQKLLDDHDSDTSSSVASLDQNHYCNLDSPCVVENTPPCSEASVSPTPSFTSESPTPNYPQKTYHQLEPYENYDPMSPEDEELLDAIWHWQQQS